MEILKANPKYAKFKHLRPILTIFNLVELHYAVLPETGIELADELLAKYSIYNVSVDNETIKQANKFKYKHKKKKLSTADVIGYSIAFTLGIKFLTGDEQFRNLDNVEFVK